jgi:hypothetical protein
MKFLILLLKYNLMSLWFCLRRRLPFCLVIGGEYPKNKNAKGLYSFDRAHTFHMIKLVDLDRETFIHELAHHLHACSFGADDAQNHSHGTRWMAAEIIVKHFFNQKGG